MPNKFAPQGIVAQSFSHTSISTAAQGDLVQIAGDFEVATATTGRAIGRIATIDHHTQIVVVELFSAQLFDTSVGATAVVAGNRVKTSAANTIIPGVAGDGLSFGIALNGGPATTGQNLPATVTVVAMS